MRSAAAPHDCAGVITEHVDGTTSPCTRGRACTRGAHVAVEDCHGVPEQCDYCRTLRCEHEVIEHHNGAEECVELGIACPPGSWHAGGLIACEDVYGHEHTCPPDRLLPGIVG